ncbi:hypothetical protein [Roseomonas sp. WA12]
MYFEFGQTLQAGLDCAGDLSPDQGAVFGWVRHPADMALTLRVEGRPGEPMPTLLLDLHPRRDVDLPEGMAVSGFSLLHDIPRDAPGRLLIIGIEGREVAIDLLAYELPMDVEAVTLKREWGATFQLLRASALDPAQIQTLTAEGRPLGIFQGWLDRLPRLEGNSEWFMDFRRVSAVLLPDGELTVSGAFNQPSPEGGRATILACALVHRPDAGPEVVPLLAERYAPLDGGFTLSGWVHAPEGMPPGTRVEAAVQVRRDSESWWFRAEAAPATLPEFLATLSLTGVDLSGPDLAALHGWMRAGLEERGEALRGTLASLGLAGAPARPGGTALLFDVKDEYAARVLALLAPQLEARFGRIVLSGTAAAGAASALMRRGRLDVAVAGDTRDALQTALYGAGPLASFDVAPIDTAALVDAAIEGNPARLTANALSAERLGLIEALHGLAGVGEMDATLRRVVALMAGADASALPVPGAAGGRADAIGGLMAEHLRELWEMVPVSGTPR